MKMDELVLFDLFVSTAGQHCIVSASGMGSVHFSTFQSVFERYHPRTRHLGFEDC